MRLAALAAFLALVAASAAHAKGPIEASVDGPGLGSPLTIRGEGEDALANGSPIMVLAEAAGFFPAAFTQEPSPLLAARPAGPLGPRYVVEYRVPGPDGSEFRIVQDAYPYARPVAVTYMPPGQELFETGGTRGGWFAARELRSVLVEAGLPDTPPGAGGESSPLPWGLAALAVAGLALGLAALGVRAVRRPRPAPSG